MHPPQERKSDGSNPSTGTNILRWEAISGMLERECLDVAARTAANYDMAISMRGYHARLVSDSFPVISDFLWQGGRVAKAAGCRPAT